MAVNTVTLGVEDEDLRGFKYYPNPVTDALNLSAQAAIAQVQLYNVLGSQVMQVNPDALSYRLNMQALPRGIYFAKVTIGNTTETVRVIKK